MYQEEAQLALNSAIESAPDACDTGDQWQFRRGEISQLRRTAGFEMFVRAYLEQKESEANYD